MSDEEFREGVLQRLTAVETELRLMRRFGFPASGGIGGAVVAALLIVARMMGLV